MKDKTVKKFYDIEKIIAKRTTRDGSREYLVKWQGYGYDQRTWEPLESFAGLKLVEEYENELCIPATDLPRFEKTAEWQNTGTDGAEIMVFHPTMEEFRDFSDYIRKIEEHGAHVKNGICKIIPPKEWNPRPTLGSNYDDVKAYEIQRPCTEVIEGEYGTYIKHHNFSSEPMTVAEFQKHAESVQYARPKNKVTIQELEKFYWENILKNQPIYGADTPGLITEGSVKEFNMAKLGTILDMLDEQGIKIPGVNTVFLYFGMWKTTFAWHCEDVDLYSINYLHYGDPKFWYAIPPDAADRFDRLAIKSFPEPEEAENCEAFLRHKNYIISPEVLEKHAIPYGTMVQYPGEFIITFPKGYHMGFNTGYNCAESTNFALERWVDFGKNAVLCFCYDLTVRINMEPFMKKLLPNDIKDWLENFKNFQKPDLNKERKLKKAVSITNGLWVRKSIPNFDQEKTYNMKQAKEFPHCAVCQYFVPSMEVDRKSPRRPVKIPDRSKRYITNEVFRKWPNSDSSPVPLFEDDGLLTCESCSLVVHAGCYLRRGQKDAALKWKCERCMASTEEVVIAGISCHLCEFRSGALIKATKGTDRNAFVHVVCAIMNRSTKFMDPNQASGTFTHPLQKFSGAFKDPELEKWELPVEYRNFKGFKPKDEMMDTKRFEPQSEACYKCYVCCYQLEGNFLQCEHCAAEQHPHLYHATCAKLADFHFELREFPGVAVPICSKHCGEVPVKFEPNSRVNVVLQEEEGRYKKYLGMVVENIAETECAIVEFLNGETRADIGMMAIKGCECKRMGCKGDYGEHILGSLVYVEVKTEDETILKSAYYRGKIRSKYRVTIKKEGEATFVEVASEFLYLRKETMPDYIRPLLAKRKSKT